VPIVRRILGWLALHGLTDVVLNLHHRPETITAVLGDGSDLGVHARYSWEQPVVLGSGGGPRQALPIVGADTFVIANGDTLTDLDLGALVEAHAQSGALVTLALVRNREFDRYGGVRVDRDGAVEGFVARGPAAEGSYHYIGVQVACAAAFASIGAGQVARSIGGAYDALIASRSGLVRAFICDAAFWDIGTVADYWRTSQAFAREDDDDGGGRPSGRPDLRIDASARVSRSILWDDVSIGPDAIVEDCIVTDAVTVPAGARYRRSVLLRGPHGDLVVEPLAA
jgi:NDP-sugar pyrophosphorylase family protein